ncbi:MAG: hypothetical protein RIR53_72 [Bacteroidota bacterium]|jgi:hypothetical protein
MYKGRLLTSCKELKSRFKGKGLWVRSWVAELALPAIACMILFASCSESGNLVRETTIDTIRLDYQIPNLTLQMRVDDPQLVGRRIVKVESSCSCLGVKILDGHYNANRGVLCEVRIDVPMTSVLKTVSFDLLLDDSSVARVNRALYLMYDIDFSPATGVLVTTTDGDLNSGYVGLEVKSNTVETAEIEYDLVIEDSLHFRGRVFTPKDRKVQIRIPVITSRSRKGSRIGRVHVRWRNQRQRAFYLYESP